MTVQDTVQDMVQGAIACPGHFRVTMTTMTQYLYNTFVQYLYNTLSYRNQPQGTRVAESSV